MKAGLENKRKLMLILQSIFGAENVYNELRFHPVRRWRFDYAVPSSMLAVEYHGHSGFINKSASGHSTIKGLTNDCEKSNQARALGWMVFAFTALHFCPRGRAKHKLTHPEETIRQAITGRIRSEA